MVFDDYSFSKSEAEGCYIFALYNKDGVLDDAGRDDLADRHSPESLETNTSIFRVTL